MTTKKETSAPSVPKKAVQKPNARKAAFIGIVIIAAVILVVASLRAMQPEPAITERTEKAWSVSAASISAANIHPQLQLLGSVESPFTSTLSAAVNADIVSVPISEGDHVTAQQQLIILDDREARLTLAQRQADAEDFEAQIQAEINRHKQDLVSLKNEEQLVALAENGVKRESELKKSNVTSDAKIDLSRQSFQQQQLSLQARQLSINNHPSRMAQLKAKTLKAQALLELAQLDLERTHIRAPFDGIISSVKVSPGERVRPGDTLIELYDIGRIEIRAQIPSRSIAKIRATLAEGNVPQAHAMAPGSAVPVTLARLAGVVNKGGGGVDAIFTVPTSAASVVIGQTLTVVLELPEEPGVFSVPVSAIYGENSVYKIEEARLKAVSISKIGQRFEGEKIIHLIQSPELKDGDQVVVTQLANAVSGLKVNLRQ